MVRTTAILPLLAAASPALGLIAVPHRYVVEFADGADVTGFYDRLVDAAARTRKNFTSPFFRGASIEMTDVETSDQTIEEIRQMPNMRVYPVTLVPAPDDQVVWTASGAKQSALLQKRQDEGEEAEEEAEEKDEFSTHLQTQVDRLRAEGLTGKGIRVAVIDTGIDYNHPMLGGCYGPGCKVAYGWDFAGDEYSGGKSTPVKDWDPMDCNGHGTHVAGIVASQSGNDFGVQGAAPGVTLGAYKVFGCSGGVENDVLIEAFIRAADDGSDIITASIGGPGGWSEEPWCVAAQRIVEQGIPCTIAAGNAGDAGLFYASSAASGKGVIAVASVDNTHSPQLLTPSLFAIDDGEKEEWVWTAGNPKAFVDTVDLPLVAFNFNITDPANGCEDWPADVDLTGKIAFIRRGTCTFVEKATRAAAKGAQYVILYNNVPGTITVDVSEVFGIRGIGMVSPEQGEAWIKALEEGSEVRLTIGMNDFDQVRLVNTPNELTGDLPSQFTSWGPTWELDVKPIIAAPGGSILSTLPLDGGVFGVLSGTSMATPLVAGTLALMMEKLGKVTPSTFERLLANTAKPVKFSNGSATFDFYAPVPQQGNGVIQAYDATFASSILDKSSLLFNDTDHAVASQEFTITNNGDEEITYEFGNLQAATVYLKSGSGPDDFMETFPTDLTEEYTDIAFEPESITIAPGEEATIKVTPTPADSLDAERIAVWSGWVTVNASDGALYHLAYQGVAGSMQSLAVIGHVDFLAIPRPGRINETIQPITEDTDRVFNLPIPGTANLTTRDVQYSTTFPGFLIALNTGSLYTDLEIIPVSGDNEDADAEQEPGTHREGPWLFNPKGPADEVLYWDGEFRNGSFAAEGRYKFRFRALKVFGEPENLEDWEVKDMPAFNIRYVDLLEKAGNPPVQPGSTSRVFRTTSKSSDPSSWFETMKKWFGF